MAASGSLNSPTLGLTRVDLGDGPWGYNTAVAVENILNQRKDVMDSMAGFLTASCYSLFQVSSSFDGLAGGSDVSSEYTRNDRVIQEVVAWAAASGSGGVTTVDVQVQGPAGNFVSIFGPVGGPSSAAMQVALSASLGNYGIAKQGNTKFVSGSNMVWRAGSLLKCQFTTAAGAAGGSAMKNITVQVFWSPSGSFAGRTAHP